jgi:hypothetical protein
VELPPLISLLPNIQDLKLLYSIANPVFINGTDWYKMVQDRTMARTWKAGKETTMAMLISLLTIAVLIVSMYAGHRFNMRLYAHGALGGHAGKMQSIERESYAVRRDRDASLVRVRDYGLHYARTGILIVAVLMLVLVFSVVILISSVL